MKPFLHYSFLLLIAAVALLPAKAQLKLGDNPTSINRDALLELNSDHQGLLFPRVLKAQIVAGGGLFGAVDGLMVYVTDESALYLKKGGIWTRLGDYMTVNGKSGPAVSLNTGDIPEGTNLYYTDARARAAFSAGNGISISGTGVIDNTGMLSAWSVDGNDLAAGKFLGTTNAADIVFKTNNAEAGRLLADGRWQMGSIDNADPKSLTAKLMVKNRMIIEGNSPDGSNELIFTKSSAGGVMRIADDQNDFQLQGGKGLNLALGASKGIVLYGDGNVFTNVPANSTTGTGVLIPAQQNGSVPLGIQASSTLQTANLTEWRNSTGTALSVVDKAGNLALGANAAVRTLHVAGTMRLTGSITGTTATSLMARDANGDVLAITPPVNPNPAWSLSANNLNINNATAIWNANQLLGNTIPAPVANRYLQFDGANLVWSSVTSMPGLTKNNIWVGNASNVATPLAAPSSNNQLLAYDNTGNVNWVPQSNFLSNQLTDGKFWLGNGGTATQTTMSGDATISNTGVLTIGTGKITTAKIANLAVTNAQIANNTITNAQIASNTITNAQIANNTIGTGQLANGAVGLTQLSNGTGNAVLTTSATGVPQWTVGFTNAVFTTDNTGKPQWSSGTFQSNALPNAQMWVGNSSGTAAPVVMGGDATINNSGNLTINNNAITSGKIANNAVGTGQLANNAVGLTQMSSGTPNAYLTTNNAGTPQWTVGTPLTNALSNGQLWVGNGANNATPVTMSGDATISNTGVITLTANAVVTNDITNAAVTGAKIAQMGAANNQVLTWNGSTWAPAAAVTSVGLSMPNIFAVTSSPVTTTGTLTASLATQAPNTVWAGPATGSTSTAPAFRTLTAADIPTLGNYIQNQFTAAQVNSNFWISGNGRTGGTMEIGGASGTITGLKFTGINSSTTPAASNNVMLTLDASGNVILAKNPATANWLTTGNSSPGAGSFLGTITDDLMSIKSSNLPFLTFGKRGLIPGLTQNYPGYQNALEKVTYVQSALQFQADGASFYKPKMWTDSLGNFHMMGPMAGTDYFEFAAGGINNAGEFDITSGDDGDEPIVFRNYFFSTGAITEWARVQKGKFGINTPGTEPARTLHVNGDMRVVNDAAGANPAKVLTKDTNGDVASVSGSANGQVLQYSGTQWTAGPQLLHYTNIATGAVSSFNGDATGTVIIDLAAAMGSVNIATGATVMVNFRAPLPAGVAMAWVLRNANQKIQIGFTNASSAGAVIPVNTIDVTIIQ